MSWSALSRFRGRPWVPALLALDVLLLLWGISSSLYQQHLLDERRAHESSDLQAYAHALTEELDEHFTALILLKTLITVKLEMDTPVPDLGSLGAETLVGTEGVRSVWIAPGGIVQSVYPLAGNERLLGHNVLLDAHARVREDVLTAIQSRRITVSDQIDQETESADWIAWLAVFTDDTFWGLVALQMDPAHVLHALNRQESGHPLWVALRDESGVVVRGPESVFENDPVLWPVDRPEVRWELGAIPANGWFHSIQDQLKVFQVGGLVVALLLAGVVYLNARHHLRLTDAVEQRTRELSRVNDLLMQDIASREQVESERRRLLEQLEKRVAERTHHLKTLYDVAAVANASADLRIILERALARIVEAVSAESGVIELFEQRDGEPRTVVHGSLPPVPCLKTVPSARSTEPAEPCCPICSDPAGAAGAFVSTEVGLAFSRPGNVAHVGVPIRGKGQLMGVLCLFRPVGRPFTTDETALLSAVGEQVGVAVESARLFAAAQKAAILEERQRLAGELHDSVTQLIYSDVLLAEASRQVMASGDLAAVDQYLGRIGESARQALKEMRLLLFDLRHSGLAREGLTAGLQRRLDAVERRAGVSAQMLVSANLDLPPSVEEELFRVASEALNNSLKHAAATSVAVEVRSEGDSLVLRVSDNGRGFDPASAVGSGGLGLVTMRERVERLGGSLAIESAPGGGTVVHVDLRLGNARSAGQTGDEVACAVQPAGGPA